uniref:Uncharacterized protein n=1 Tax=Opuntia streptacantha TaxID=393608 RepID=A0A7C9FHN0_OPUST
MKGCLHHKHEMDSSNNLGIQSQNSKRAPAPYRPLIPEALWSFASREYLSSQLYCFIPHNFNLILFNKTDQGLSSTELQNGIKGFKGDKGSNEARKRGFSRPSGSFKLPLFIGLQRRYLGRSHANTE